MAVQVANELVELVQRECAAILRRHRRSAERLVDLGGDLVVRCTAHPLTSVRRRASAVDVLRKHRARRVRTIRRARQGRQRRGQQKQLHRRTREEEGTTASPEIRVQDLWPPLPEVTIIAHLPLDPETGS